MAPSPDHRAVAAHVTRLDVPSGVLEHTEVVAGRVVRPVAVEVHRANVCRLGLCHEMA